MKQVYTPAQRAEGKIKLVAARLAGRYPFHAGVLGQFQVTCVPDVGTMGVTIRGGELLLLHNPQFVLDLPADELGGVLLHEVHHIVLGHVTTDPDEYPDAWACIVAQELCVNEYVKEPLPEGAITLEQFPGLPALESTARRYERLKNVQDRFPIQGLELDLPGSGGGPGDADSQNDEQATAGGAETSPTGGRVIDNHAVWQEAIDNPQAALDVIRDALQQAALEAGTEGLKGALREVMRGLGLGSGSGIGTEPGGGQYRLLGERDGQLDWRHLLRTYIGQELDPHPALTRPPRRFPELVGIVPAHSRRQHRAHVMAVIDTSGSITEDMLEMIDGELRRLGRAHSVTVVECDVAIHKVYRYRRLESVTGRGGTDFRPPLEPQFLRKHRPDLLIYFTDGFGPAPERAPRVPLIWCLVPGGEVPAPWGRVLWMGTDAEQGE